MVSTTSLSFDLPMSYTLEPATAGYNGIMVLHGFGDRAPWARRRMLGDEKWPSYHLFSPNGFFPYPIKKGYEFDEAYAWYFRDPHGHEMISPEVAAQTMKRLLEKLNLGNINWTVVGFSQGGFFAPHLLRAGIQVSRIIAVGAAFRSQSYQDLPPVKVYALHGELDDVVEPQISQQSFDVIERMGYGTEFHLIKGLKHSLNEDGRKIVKRILSEAP